MSKDPKKIVNVMERVVKERAIVTIKVGVSEDDKSAIRRHTASVAEDPEIVEKVMREAGVIRVYEVDEMIDTVAALSRAPLPKRAITALADTCGYGRRFSTD